LATTLKLSPGKQRGLRALCDARGVIAALAIDQRTALRSLFARAMDRDSEHVPAQMLVDFKEAVSRELTRHASAILLDPEYGLPAARQRDNGAGLLLAYEQSGYDKSVPGRFPHLLERWSARRLVAAGADGVKVLLYYSQTSPRETNEVKHALMQRVGAECAAADVPFFLELVSYAEGIEDKSEDFARVKPDIVISGVEEFSKPIYRVDVLKVGFPVDLAFVEGCPGAQDGVLHTREEARKIIERASAASGVPFIYLSEGVSNETFVFGLQLAGEAGSDFSGVLCGRATWKDGVNVYVREGREALKQWLESTGVSNIRRVNVCLRVAKPLRLAERAETPVQGS
jgi:tagatose 1,6-diphosphate aldolase